MCRNTYLRTIPKTLLCLLQLLLFQQIAAVGQSGTLRVLLDEKQQIIDGFGSHQGNDQVDQQWWKDLFFEDLRATIYRVDLTPRLVAPYSDLNVYSPWFMGSGTNSVFNLEDTDNPNGPEGNRVRTYTGPQDYSRDFGGENAPIAVMGPDIDYNVNYFTYSPDGAIAEGKNRIDQLGDFKLIGSVWSPLPWVKVSSGNTYNQNWWPGPVQGSAWPFIWGGNFAGGRLDVSELPLEVFNDAGLGGNGPTSSLTQFARSTAAYIRGYQDFHQVQFYAVSIQNELNFEEFYNSATYPLSSQYIAALKAVRAEFDKYDDLKDIRIMGPEDLLGGDAYGMWQYGGNDDPTHKNLQYLQNLSNDQEAMDAVDFFCIHGYDGNGVSASGATSTLWDWWANGWEESPAAGIPGNVEGYLSYGKKCWMTETSGESRQWLAPASGYPNGGGWSVALRIHQALVAGRQSAWVYWTFTESDDSGNPSSFALSNQSLGVNSPKYVAAKHFFRYIRPNAYRVSVESESDDPVLASAYTHDEDGTVTVVLINSGDTELTRTVEIPGLAKDELTFDQFTSRNGQYWQSSTNTFQSGSGTVTLPAYSVVTLYGTEAISTGLFGPDPGINAPFRLHQNTPNPFTEQSQIRFELDRSANIQLKLIDIHGQVIKVLLDEKRGAGMHTVALQGGDLPAGTYFYALNMGEYRLSRKLIIVK
jgi:O-glycosyl hydrolase